MNKYWITAEDHSKVTYCVEAPSRELAEAMFKNYAEYAPEIIHDDLNEAYEGFVIGSAIPANPDATLDCGWDDLEDASYELLETQIEGEFRKYRIFPDIELVHDLQDRIFLSADFKNTGSWSDDDVRKLVAESLKEIAAKA